MLKEIQVAKYSIESGLSQCIVTAMIQDSRGFIWLGTQKVVPSLYSGRQGICVIINGHKSKIPNLISKIKIYLNI